MNCLEVAKEMSQKRKDFDTIFLNATDLFILNLYFQNCGFYVRGFIISFLTLLNQNYRSH